MFKYIILILFFICSNLNAQESEHPTTFKFTRDAEPQARVGYWSRLNDYVVVEVNGSAEENYRRVLNYVKSVYKNPEEVIVAESENRFIKISGFAPGLYYMGIGGYVGIRYNLTIFVKENKMKIKINSMERYFEEYGWIDFNGIVIHKSNGKPKKRVFGKTDKDIEDYFNGIVESLKNFKISGKKSLDDW